MKNIALIVSDLRFKTRFADFASNTHTQRAPVALGYGGNNQRKESMKIDELTIGEAKELARLFSTPATKDKEYPFQLGKCYLIRTVTMIQTGRLVGVTPTELVLEDAAWIADSGRFSDALQTGDFNEVEPFPDGMVIVGRGALIDACEITIELPRTKK